MSADPTLRRRADFSSGGKKLTNTLANTLHYNNETRGRTGHDFLGFFCSTKQRTHKGCCKHKSQLLILCSKLPFNISTISVCFYSASEKRFVLTAESLSRTTFKRVMAVWQPTKDTRNHSLCNQFVKILGSGFVAITSLVIAFWGYAPRGYKTSSVAGN